VHHTEIEQIGASVHTETYPAHPTMACGVVTRGNFSKTNNSPGEATGGKGKGTTTGAGAPSPLPPLWRRPCTELVEYIKSKDTELNTCT